MWLRKIGQFLKISMRYKKKSFCPFCQQEAWWCENYLYCKPCNAFIFTHDDFYFYYELDNIGYKVSCKDNRSYYINNIIGDFQEIDISHWKWITPKKFAEYLDIMKFYS